MTKNTTNYDENVALLRDKAFGKKGELLFEDYPSLTIQSDADLLFATLNKHHLFEDPIFDRDSKFSKELIYYQLLNILDLRCKHEFLSKRITLKGKLPAKERPVIYCSFHHGPYLQLFQAFKMLKRKFSFIIISPDWGERIVERQKKQNKSSGMYDSNPELHQPKIIGAESLDNALEIYKTLKNESVVIFIDTFVKEADKTKKRNKEIQLFNSKLFLHSGIPDISKRLKVPIIPVVSERTKDNKTEINFYDPVCHGDFNFPNYEVEAFQECFDLFSTHLKKHPEQWDQWQYLHNNLLIEPIPPIGELPPLEEQNEKTVLGFNAKLFEVFERNKELQLLKIDDYQCFKVSQKLVEILQELNQADYTLKEIKTVLGDTLCSDLWARRVLITKNHLK